MYYLDRCRKIIDYQTIYEVKHFIILQLDVTASWSLTSTTVTAKAIFISTTQIVCTLPEATGSYSVVVSNNAVTFTTTTVIVLVYDSKCYSCDFTGKCQKRVSVCNNYLLGEVFQMCLSLLQMIKMSCTVTKNQFWLH